VEGGAPILPVIGQVDPDLLPDCGPALEQMEPRLSALGIQYECRRLRSTSAPRALQTEAELADAGLLAVGSSRRAGVGRVLAGSTAERLMHGSPCPVGVAPLEWKAEQGEPAGATRDRAARREWPVRQGRGGRRGRMPRGVKASLGGAARDGTGRGGPGMSAPDHGDAWTRPFRPSKC
jgi:hypothetical protein